MRRPGSDEREKLIKNPPVGAWIEAVRKPWRVYYYLRWREQGRKVGIRLKPEEVPLVRERLEISRLSLVGLAQLLDYERFARRVRELAESGDQDAQLVAKRLKKDRWIIKRVLKLLMKIAEQER